MSLEALPAPPSLPNADDPATLTGVTYFRAAPDPEDALAKALVAADGLDRVSFMRRGVLVTDLPHLQLPGWRSLIPH